MTIVLVVLGMAVVMIAIEHAQPGRSWPAIAGWWTQALALNALQIAVVFVAGVAWDGWMARHRPWSADWLGVTPGALLGYLTVTFIYYWWHRWRHHSSLLWRWLHQIHHSAPRIEVVTSFYKHPMELVVNGLLSSAIVYLLLGLEPQAASYAVMLTGLAELFYHWNVRTPHWLGYLVQRPESHCIHHEDGVHAYNYADLPVWDMLFGTFKNPRSWQARCGFGACGEHRLAQMLRGMDVNAVRAGRTPA